MLSIAYSGVLLWPIALLEATRAKRSTQSGGGAASPRVPPCPLGDTTFSWVCLCAKLAVRKRSAPGPSRHFACVQPSGRFRGKAASDSLQPRLTWSLMTLS
jgi:hypothetical protein